MISLFVHKISKPLSNSQKNKASHPQTLKIEHTLLSFYDVGILCAQSVTTMAEKVEPADDNIYDQPGLKRSEVWKYILLNKILHASL